MARRNDRAVLTVVEPFPPIAIEPWYGGSESLARMDQKVQKHARDQTRKASESLKKKGIKVESAVPNGYARAEIIDEAKKWAADLIVMGSHGYTGIKRLLLGSVALSVVSHAPCSVEVVRRKQTKKRR